MKLHELISIDTSTQQLDEISLRQAVGAGIIAGSSLMGAKNISNSKIEPHQVSVGTQSGPTHRPVIQNIEGQKREQEKQFINNITKKYRVSSELAKKVVHLAHQYEDPVFPKAVDILAIIGIESSFNPSAISALTNDPAMGLMQVRPGVWGLDPKSLNDMESQIQMGAQILKQYYKRLKDKDSAVQAYNIGLTGFRQNKNPEGAERYLNKYNNELQNYITT